jgi:cellulose synthase/poly-beta-1,6-N-acetylglucosamine synthase-like glycosyltransferase
MRLSVLVPSYRRPKDLERCLRAIAGQARPADQVLVVARGGDAETVAVSRAWQTALPLECVAVDIPGQVQALNAGLKRCTGDVVAITDDDAAPRPEWLRRIERHFAADPALGGVGGRDWIHRNGALDTASRSLVGRVLWFGRIAGNHHLGGGPVREVDILKGANCAFRMPAIGPIGFDERLRGNGAQVHNDMAASLAVKRAGWRLIYDPQVAVDHYMSERADHDRRSLLQPDTLYNHAFNTALALDYLTLARVRRTAKLWQILVGSRSEPGLLWTLRLLPVHGTTALHFGRLAATARRAAWSNPSFPRGAS